MTNIFKKKLNNTTNTGKQTENKGDRPSHSLFVKSDLSGNAVNMRLSPIWNHPEKGYMSLSPSKLQLRVNPNPEKDQPPVELFLKTKIYGQDACVRFGDITAEEQENHFEVNLGDLVIFENKPREIVENKKTATNGQPRP